MSERKIIPAFDLYKTLDSKPGIEFSHLEESYNPYDASLPHRHNYFEILLFNGSGGIHEIDFHAYPIRESSLHFISPEQVHLLRRAKDVTGYVLSFTPDFCLGKNTNTEFMDAFPFFNNPYAAPIVTIHNVARKNLMEIVANMEEEYFSSHDDKADVLLSYLTILLIAARRMYTPDPISGTPSSSRVDMVLRFKKAIGENFRQQKSVTYYAELLNISAGHLSETVQKDTGKTAGNMIHDRIILEAKRLLYHSPKSVKEIACELGYEDPSYFARFFKTHTQTAPEMFRSNIREKYH